MRDETEPYRRILTATINSEQNQRQQLEEAHGTVWNTEELGRDFEVQGFSAPFVVVKRKSDGAVGSLMFQHMPRFYFNFEEAR